MDYGQAIIDYITRNRVSTTEVADALGKAGVLPGLLPVTPDEHKVGRVRTIFCSGGSNWDVHHQVPETQPGEVVIIFSHECQDRAILGDIVSKYILLYCRAEALVVEGAVRDVARLRRERYPVWSLGCTPLGCVNQKPSVSFPTEREADLRHLYEGGVAVCDDGGVVVIPSFCLDAEMLARLERIELQEDIWAYCLNTLKWTTKEIVCEKKYMEDSDVLSPSHQKLLNDLKHPFSKRF